MAYPHLLQPDERRELLRIARATLREYLDSGRIPPGKPHRASLLAPAAVVVRLHRGADQIAVAETAIGERPLYRAIQELAVEAITTGGLDELLTDDDLIEMHIEIGVLGAAEPQIFREPPLAT